MESRPDTDAVIPRENYMRRLLQSGALGTVAPKCNVFDPSAWSSVESLLSLALEAKIAGHKAGRLTRSGLGLQPHHCSIRNPSSQDV